MVTFKKFKYVIFSLLAIAVIASATAFSVSYAKWAAPATDSVNANLSTGNWNNKPTSVSDGIMVGDKPYYSFEYSEGSGDNTEKFDKCVIKVKKDESFQIFSRGLLCQYSGFVMDINNNLPFENADTFTYTGSSEYAFIEVTIRKPEYVISNMSIKSYSFASLVKDDVVGLLKSISNSKDELAKGILTSQDKVIPFSGTAVNLDLDEQFYIVYGSELVQVNNMKSDIQADDWQVNPNKTTFKVLSDYLCAMKGKGTISASLVSGQPNIVISLDDSSIVPTTITRIYDYGQYSYKVIYGN